MQTLSRRAFLGLAVAAGLAAATSCSRADSQRAGSQSAGNQSAGNQNSGDGRPVVFASFYPIRSLVQEIAGDALDVRSFMPDGDDPHMWEPSPQAMKALADAKLLVVNGANMEAWLPQVEQNFPELPVLRLSDYVELITYKGAAALGEFQYLGEAPIEPGESYRLVFGHTHEKNMRAVFFTAPDGTSEEDLVKLGRELMEDQGVPVAQKEEVDLVPGQVLDIDMGHESGTVSFRVPLGDEQWYFASDRVSQEILSYRIVTDDGEEVPTTPVIAGSSTGTDAVTFDPHSWLSVINAKRYCNAIEGRLSGQFPEHAKDFSKNRFDVVREITRLQNSYKELFSQAEQQEFVVSHNAFSYLARDFGLQQLSLQGLTTNEAPSLYSLVYSIRYIREADIDIVYQEYGVQDPGIQTVVSEVGGEVLPLASMEMVDPADDLYDGGYLAYMEMNLDNLAKSIK